MKNNKVTYRCLSIVLVIGIGACTKSPPPFVRDQAQLLTEQQARTIAMHHAYLLKDHDIDYRVVSVRNGGDINRYAEATFDELRVGSLSRNGRGLLLVIDAGQDRIRLEVARALEGAFPDIFVAYIERDQMVPFFRVGRIADGVLATTELIVTRAQQARAGREFEPDSLAPETAGGGAANPAEISRGASPQRARPDASAATSPQATLAVYLAAMREHNVRADLDLYTADTRAMLGRWVVTPAQMENLYKTYSGCAPEAARIDESKRYAVIRYAADERLCSPWFFRWEHDRWRLDLVTPQRAIRFGRNNAWRLVAPIAEYVFAFDDWAFDRSGYPFRPRWNVTIEATPVGNIVTYVGRGSPAATLGLSIGDKVVAIDGREPVDHAYIMRWLESVPSGATIAVRVARGGERIVLQGVAP